MQPKEFSIEGLEKENLNLRKKLLAEELRKEWLNSLPYVMQGEEYAVAIDYLLDGVEPKNPGEYQLFNAVLNDLDNVFKRYKI